MPMDTIAESNENIAESNDDANHSVTSENEKVGFY